MKINNNYELANRKRALIEIIKWCRCKKSRHATMIKKIKKAGTDKELLDCEKVVDGWLDR